MKKKIDFMITAFRDGFQSYFGSRVLSADIMPAFEAACEAGIKHFEVGGGAQFQSLIFYCNENPFEVMGQYRTIGGPDINLQTLSRGINVIGLESHPSDVIALHARLFKKHGVTTVRNFDALNDINNLVYSGKCIHSAGLRHEICITTMDMPVPIPGIHDKDFYIKILKNIIDADIPFDSLCFKDAAGTSRPAVIHETIKEARKIIGNDKKIVYHSHSSAGICLSTYIAAIEAGADQLDVSLAPVSGGTAQPDIVSLWHVLKGTDYYMDVNIEGVRKAQSVLKKCLENYVFPVEARKTDPDILFCAMPGGALTANTNMMRDQGIDEERYLRVLDKMSEVILLGGGGTSVTPVSQFYFQQAFNNEFFGPWERIADGYGKMVLGYFGKTPVKPDKKVIDTVKNKLGIDEFTGSVLEYNDRDQSKGIKPAMEKLRSEKLPITEENLFITAICGDKGINFLKRKGEVKVFKAESKIVPASSAASAGSSAGNVRKSSKGEFVVTVNGKEYKIRMDGQKAMINNEVVNFNIKDLDLPQISSATEAAGRKEEQSKPSGKQDQGTQVSSGIKSPLPGTVLRFVVKPGSRVEKGTPVLVLESMKMETEIKSPADGTIKSFLVNQGDQIATGQLLAELE